jgi:hypothetical protein
MNLNSHQSRTKDIKPTAVAFVAEAEMVKESV